MPGTKPSFSVRHPFLFGLLLLVTAVALYYGATAFFGPKRSELSFNRGPAIGLVNIEGIIAQPRAVLDYMDELAWDDDVKGVVVRLNTPGGVVAPSQELYDAVRRLRERKPVVASMGSVAASGGYYIAAAADRIVASPGTLTGSIGVKIELVNFRELAEELGIAQTQITSGKYKGAGSAFREMTEAEREYFEELVADMHDQFVTDVAYARGMDVERVRAVADGRAFTGRQARDLGLVDDLGGLTVALEICKELSGLAGQRVDLYEGPKKKLPYLQMLLEEGADGLLGILLENAAPGGMASKAMGPRWQLMYR